jgi:6,7-dimethyl-8-ribityllumazine synthase
MKDHSQTPPHKAATPDAHGVRVAVVVSMYHRDITKALEDGARRAFASAGGQPADLMVVEAPGAFELPVIAAACAARADCAGVVALGCVIAGETRHDRYINSAVTHALAQLSVTTRKPVGYGLLTVDSVKQARARAGGKHGNKGEDAMLAVMWAVQAMTRMGM